MPGKIPTFSAIGTSLNPELEKIPAEERASTPDIRIANSDWGCASRAEDDTDAVLHAGTDHGGRFFF
jgi:hypothetical protein